MCQQNGKGYAGLAQGDQVDGICRVVIDHTVVLDLDIAHFRPYLCLADGTMSPVAHARLIAGGDVPASANCFSKAGTSM
jgi:hypothetical protein